MSVCLKRMSLGVVVLGMAVLSCACTADAAGAVEVPTQPTSVTEQEDTAPPPTPGAEREDPRDVVDAFYAWYLAYEGNILVDQAYHDNPSVSPGFAEIVDERLAGFDKGGYDPFLCAQDLPAGIVVETITISGGTAEATVTSNLVGHTFQVVLLPQGQSWQITDVVCAADEASPESPTSDVSVAEGTPREVVPGWPVFIDETYRFMVQYPEGWTYEDVDLDDPNKPPVGNMSRLVYFAPEAWDQGFIAWQMEVYDMNDDAFAAVLPPATSEEEIVRDDGLSYVKYTHEFGQATMYQYLFRSVSNPNVRVIFTDYLTGWPDRLEGNEEISELYQPILASFGFADL